MECSFHKNKPVELHLELSDAMQLASKCQPQKLVLHIFIPSGTASILLPKPDSFGQEKRLRPLMDCVRLLEYRVFAPLELSWLLRVVAGWVSRKIVISYCLVRLVDLYGPPNPKGHDPRNYRSNTKQSEVMLSLELFLVRLNRLLSLCKSSRVLNVLSLK